MKKRKNIILSILLCIGLLATMFLGPVSTNVKGQEEPEFPLPPDFEEPGPPTAEDYNLYVSGISANSQSDYPEIIFANTQADVEIILKNKGGTDITGVAVDISQVFYNYLTPDGDITHDPYITTEGILTTVFYGNFQSMEEKTEIVSWTPTIVGEYKLEFSIGYTEFGQYTEYTYGATFVVVDPLTPVLEIHGDWMIIGDLTLNGLTIIVNGDITVNEGVTLTLENCNLRAGNIDIWGWAFWVWSYIDLGCTFRGQYYLWVHPGASLYLWGSVIYNNPSQFTWHCWFDGYVQSREWFGRWSVIMHVYGQGYITGVTGGIMLRNIAVNSLFRNTIVRECDTVGIGCYGSSPTISPGVHVEFCGVVGSNYGYGKGIYAEGATANPTIGDCRIRFITGSWNYGFGIFLQDDASATVSGCRIHDTGYAGIYCRESSSAVTIQSNREISENRRYGILCIRTQPTNDGPTIDDNINIRENYYGIYIYDCDPTITANTITANVYGLYCNRADDSVTDNTIESNDQDGILLYRCSPDIERNSVKYNDRWGMYIYWYSSPQIRDDNEVEDNDQGGIYMYGFCSPQIYDNSIQFNGAPDNPTKNGIRIVRDCSPDITYNDIRDNYLHGIWSERGSNPLINQNNIVNNGGGMLGPGYGVYNADTGITVDARWNWWGSSNGPSGVGSGTGDKVSSNVNYIPWLTVPMIRP